ncbi:WD40-repeat-containing domain protein [Jimgerdemannia flammicorona]|uniref:WD40-repeat-containing domain protein n=2 Tax=Jimgerdemannia flammicorona TaxID=994334 RepID=A0A433QWI8_9FUNG|nr:WD40-repeat-containing domain protein [Jimgerdemannia flammicorona]RUS34159.1 WD40-repeat-containing domain protein [Jimgerdemannia flammicorona]
MISALHWIQRGVALQHPEKYNLDEKEFQRISALAAEQLQDARADLANAQRANGIASRVFANVFSTVVFLFSASSAKEEPAKAILADDELAKYDLEHYDDPPEEGDGQSMNIFSSIKGLTYYPTNEDDPYITLKDNGDDEDERAELEILSTDSLLVAAKTEDDISHLEVYVYETEDENLYVHHDIMLPAFPLCLEWLDFRLGRKSGQEGGGNYIAVGTFEPEIEIWDLDVVDCMYPDAILGQQNKGKEKKKKSKSKKANAEHHTDAVMSLSWNELHRNLLASSSADTTVKLWDLTTLSCAHSFTHHTSKVQTVIWHPTESTVLLTGSYDRTVAAFDSRAPAAVSQWRVTSDVETLKWDPHHPTHFYVSTEEGIVMYYDGRVTEKAVYILHAHDSAVSTLEVNPCVPGCIVTGSVDKIVKVWDVKDSKPRMVTSRDLGLGKIFSASFCPDAPFHLAVAGSKGQVQVWDLSSNAGVRRAFEGRTPLIAKVKAEVVEVCYPKRE